MKIRVFPLIFCLFALLGCSQKVVESDSVQIVQIESVAFFNDHTNLIGDEPSVGFHVDKKHKCNPPSIFFSAFISPSSLNMSNEAFAQLLLQIVNRDPREYYVFHYDNKCNDGQYKGIFVTKIEACTAEKCGKYRTVGDNVLWIEFNPSSFPYSPQDYRPIPSNTDPAYIKKKALFILTLPLKYEKEKNAWRYQLRYESEPEIVALEGYINQSDWTAIDAIFVHEYKGYDIDGNLAVKVQYTDEDGMSLIFTEYDEDGGVSEYLIYDKGKLIKQIRTVE